MTRFQIERTWKVDFGDIKAGTVAIDSAVYDDKATAEAVVRERRSKRHEQRVVEVSPLTTAAAAWRKLPARARMALLRSLRQEVLTLATWSTSGLLSKQEQKRRRDDAEASRAALKMLRAAMKETR